MVEMSTLMLLAGPLGFGVTFLCVPLVRRIALTYGVVDHPGGRRLHEKPTPLLGGTAIFVPFALIFGFYSYLGLSGAIPDGQPDRLQMVTLFLGALWMLILGTVDDVIGIGWNKKLVGELVAVAILMYGGHSVSKATIPFFGLVDFGWWGMPLFAVTVLTITNAINLVDGLDGLAGGICLFAAIASGIIGWSKGDLFTATVAFTISGSLLGFLIYNFPPASIYMGDGGSLTMGFLLGTLATSCSAMSPGQRSGTMVMVLLPFLPFGIALLDVILAVLRRWITGRKIFLPDADHLHHRLMEKFQRPRRVVVILYSFSALLCAITLSVVLGPKSDALTAFLVISGCLIIGVVVAVLRLYRIEHLAKAIENRPHFQFVSSYRAFMTAKLRRVRSFEELIALLQTGIPELGFDSVEVLNHGQTMRVWVNPTKLHPESPRVCSERTFDGIGLAVRWIAPTHESESYQKFLHLTWYGLLTEFGSRMEQLAVEERGAASAVMMSPKQVSDPFDRG